jgi:hypothetical protein
MNIKSNGKSRMRALLQTLNRPSLLVLHLAVLVALIAGCASQPEVSPVLREQALSFSPPPGGAGVYLIRPPNGLFSSGAWGFTLDDEDLGFMKSELYLYGVVEPGGHVIRIRSLRRTEDEAMRFTAEPDKNYFFTFKVHYKPPFFAQISEVEGQALVRKFKFSDDNRFVYHGANGLHKSTILIKVDVPLSTNLTRFLQVLNLDTKTMLNDLPVGPDGWVACDVPPGRYLIANYVEWTSGVLAVASRKREIRCEIEVPKPGVAIFYGTIGFSNVGGVQIKRGIDSDVRNFYKRSAADKRPELIEGEIKREVEAGGS